MRFVLFLLGLGAGFCIGGYAYADTDYEPQVRGWYQHKGLPAVNPYKPSCFSTYRSEDGFYFYSCKQKDWVKLFNLGEWKDEQ